MDVSIVRNGADGSRSKWLFSETSLLYIVKLTIYRSESRDGHLAKLYIWLEDTCYCKKTTTPSTQHIPTVTTHKVCCWGGFANTQKGILLGVPRSAMCVQNFDDSRRYAIRITYRISLRSSSLCEPRHPLLKVVRHLRIMWRGGVSRRYNCSLHRTFFFFRLICLLFCLYCGWTVPSARLETAKVELNHTISQSFDLGRSVVTNAIEQCS